VDVEDEILVGGTQRASARVVRNAKRLREFVSVLRVDRTLDAQNSDRLGNLLGIKTEMAGMTL
jgi:hypothetical protein